MENLIGINEVAKRYGKDVRQIRYAIGLGQITPIKIGYGLVFDVNKLPKTLTVRAKARNKKGENENE